MSFTFEKTLIYYLYIQVESVKSAMTNHNDPMFGTSGLCDPSDEIVEVLIKANDWNMLSRRRRLSVDQVVELDTSAKEFLTALKQTFPERTGTTDANGNLIGWRTEKIHSLLHKLEW